MNRRGFIGSIGAALAGTVLDPERLLWVPGQKVISIPKPSVFITPHQLSEMILSKWKSNLFNPAYDVAFLYSRDIGKVGHTINVRKPPAFIGRI